MDLQQVAPLARGEGEEVQVVVEVREEEEAARVEIETHLWKGHKVKTKALLKPNKGYF